MMKGPLELFRIKREQRDRGQGQAADCMAITPVMGLADIGLDVRLPAVLDRAFKGNCDTACGRAGEDNRASENT